MPDSQQLLLRQIYAGLIIVIGAGIPALILYARWRKRNLFPDPAPCNVPWNGWAVVAAFVIAVLIPAFVQIGFVQSGLPQLLYGPDFPQIQSAEDLETPEIRQAANVLGLWAQMISLPLQLIVIFLVFKLGVHATLPQMGLSTERWQPNYVLGYFGWLAIAPLSYLVYLAAIALLAPNPDAHPLLNLGKYGGKEEWVAFAIQVSILAPLNEEFLVRGLLLFWLLQSQRTHLQDPQAVLQPLRPELRSHIVYLAAFFLSVQLSPLPAAIAAHQWDRILDVSHPSLFVLFLGPLYFLLPSSTCVRDRLRLDSAQAVRAMISSSMLFAAVHSKVWPSPIPLFTLGLGLGWLAIRTRSILPAIIVHMLFNAVAAVSQVLG